MVCLGDNPLDLMKAIALLLTCLMTGCLVSARAQTNSVVSPVVFPELRSITNSLLMTNAEFRCTVGSKVFFQSGDDEHGFEAESLDPDVLSSLGLSLDALKEAQARLDAQKHMAAAEYQVWLANHLKQEQQAAAAQAAAEAAAATATTNTNSIGHATGNSTNPKPAPKHYRHGFVAGG
jgi:hypothetical protein